MPAPVVRRGGGDPLHLTAVLDIDTSTAIRYAANARRLRRWVRASCWAVGYTDKRTSWSGVTGCRLQVPAALPVLPGGG